jgi:hypothetical protein
MNAVVTNIDHAIRTKAVEAARWLPRGADTESSRLADKFVIRGYEELFAEIERLADLQLRSKNSEVNMAIMDSINGRVQSSATLSGLCAYLGEELSAEVLAVVPEFVMCEATHTHYDKFVIRFPDEVRPAMTQASIDEGSGSMIAWIRQTLTYWINAQRQQHALLAAITVIKEYED